MRFFTTVRQHVSIQITSFRGCKVAQFAFMALFANVCFQMTFQITRSGRCIVTLVALDFSPLCVLTCTLRLLALEQAKSHWLQ